WRSGAWCSIRSLPTREWAADRSVCLTGRSISFTRAHSGLRRLDLAISRRRTGGQRVHKTPGHLTRLVYRPVERLLVGLRRHRESTDLPDKLQRRGANLLVCGGRLEIEERPDVPAHTCTCC